MSITVKICGLKDAASLDAALAAGADMIGLVFFPKSARHLGLGEAAALAERARGRADIVAVTVDPDDALIAEIATVVRPDFIQLHGGETPARAAAVKLRSSTKLIKAIRIGAPGDADAARGYDGIADLILFDAAPAKDADLPGGNGLAFDWRLLEGAPARYVLSGGLDPETVGAAVARLNPYAVDVSSGVESSPGVKDVTKIAAFIAAAKTELASAS